MREGGSGNSSIDIFQLLIKTTEEEKRKRREELLKPLGIKEYFTDGEISVNMRICQGVECRLCIKACPTKALYWKDGEIEIIRDLCIYCGACVLNCMVDDCIKIRRKRPSGETEAFSKPSEFIKLEHKICKRKRLERVESVFPTPEKYLEKKRRI